MLYTEPRAFELKAFRKPSLGEVCPHPCIDSLFAQPLRSIGARFSSINPIPTCPGHVPHGRPPLLAGTARNRLLLIKPLRGKRNRYTDLLAFVSVVSVFKLDPVDSMAYMRRAPLR